MENIHGDVVGPNSPNRRDLSPRLLTNAVKLLGLQLHEAPQNAPCERQTGVGGELNTTIVFLSISRGRGEAEGQGQQESSSPAEESPAIPQVLWVD